MSEKYPPRIWIDDSCWWRAPNKFATTEYILLAKHEAQLREEIAKTYEEAAGFLPVQWSAEKDAPGSTDKMREFFEHKAREAREGEV